MTLMLEREYRLPVITAYTLAEMLFRVLLLGEYDGRPLRIRPRYALPRDLTAVKNALEERGIFKQDRSLQNTVFRLSDRSQSNPEDVLCTINPFGFMSHLSAMAYHGLTNRIPAVMFFTTLKPIEWRTAADERMARELGEHLADYRANGLPPLRRPHPDKIQGYTIKTVLTSEPGGYQLARDGALRVAKLGRTFLDMLQRPELCGGMGHVIDVFRDQAPKNLSILINELNQHGTKIDRVRAGYLLEDRCAIRDPRIESWILDAQRGGSRRLDAKGEYVSTFSERWKLSINV